MDGNGMVDITAKTALTVGKGAYDVLQNAYQARQKKRVEKFFRCVELRYEVMNKEDQSKLNTTINSEEGKEILASYVDAITQTSSDRVRMAVAMLYCQDKDFSLTEAEQRVFISGVAGITDHLVDFFLEVAKLSPSINELITYPYDRHEFKQQSLNKLKLEGIDGEVAYRYFNDLISRGLLLPDPQISSVAGKYWVIYYGTSQRVQTIARLLEKTDELLP